MEPLEETIHQHIEKPNLDLIHQYPDRKPDSINPKFLTLENGNGHPK